MWFLRFLFGLAFFLQLTHLFFILLLTFSIFLHDLFEYLCVFFDGIVPSAVFPLSHLGTLNLSSFLRAVGVMWWSLLIQHLHLSAKIARFVVKNEHQIDMCYDENG